MSDATMPVVIGLTGGIASGKSTVTSMMRELGVHVIDADAIARQIVSPGSEALTQIREAFGPSILLTDGSLDRTELGARVFEDADARQTLNGITHPKIAVEMMNQAMQAAQQGHSWVIYDAALLVENNAQEWLPELIVVTLAPEIQLERLMARDKSSQESAQARIDSQLPLEDKVAVADHVIDNGGTREQTHTQVTSLVAQLRNKHGA